MTEFVLPTHANALGGVFGGQVLAWCDLAAAICAQRHTGHVVITAGFDDVSFEKPIKVGQVVRLTARITAAFHTSVEILVDVQGEDATTGDLWPCLTAFVTFVAVGPDMRPVAVPPLAIETEEERKLAEEAAERRSIRLSRRRRPAAE